MFYISSVGEPFKVSGWNEELYNKIGVTDTYDNVEVFYTNKQLYSIIKKADINIYGTFCYGKTSREMYVFATPMKYNESLSKSKLYDLFNNNKKKHNPWSLYPISDYLASVSVGSSFKLTWSDTGSSGETFTSSLSAKKVSDDLWDYDSSYLEESRVTSSVLAQYLDYPSCVNRLRIY